MNALKFVANTIIKNHNNSDKFSNARDAHLRNVMYSRLARFIELAKTGEMDIIANDNKMVVTNLLDDNFDIRNNITIYKSSKYYKELLDFFYGLKRTNNVIGFLNYYKHMNPSIKDDTKIHVNRYDNSATAKLIPVRQ